MIITVTPLCLIVQLKRESGKNVGGPGGASCMTKSGDSDRRSHTKVRIDSSLSGRETVYVPICLERSMSTILMKPLSETAELELIAERTVS